MSEQTQSTSKKKVTKKAQRKAKTPKAKAAEKQEDLVVFAFRLSQAEREAIHMTAGPARASRYVRGVSAAFAAEDVEAFKAVLKEAREARG